MHHFYGMIVPLFGIAATVIIGLKIMDYLKLKATLSEDGMRESGGSLEEVQTRLAEIERRLTDVQDVMIALSEKFDHWEAERLKI